MAFIYVNTLKVKHPRFSDLSTEYFHFHGKQSLRLALQNLNWLVNYNLYHVDEKFHQKWEEIHFDILWTFR